MQTQRRSVGAWVVIDRRGKPMMNTIRPTRVMARIAYAQTSDLGEWKHYMEVNGVRVVRCTITTEPPATPATMEER